MTCGFLQCPELSNALSYYEGLRDVEYEASREQRRIQARKLLRLVQSHCPSGRLLDVGAGSGILVEQARELGYDAEGVEPSRWLQQRAASRALRVHLGGYPHPDILPGFDVVTLVDVIEHVSNPLELLARIREQLNDQGVGLLVTPDENSLAARLMGWEWWHFRTAHIGYFNRRTLLFALRKAGLKAIRMGRPGWHFRADYLLDCLNRYLPLDLPFSKARFVKRVTVPLNLRDSLYVVFKKEVLPRHEHR